MSDTYEKLEFGLPGKWVVCCHHLGR